jgi:hypothetical protein
MKAQIRAKTRNQGRDWAVFCHSNKKRVAEDLVGFMAGDALSNASKYERWVATGRGVKVGSEFGASWEDLGSST